MSNTFDFLMPLLDYVKTKAESFLDLYELGDCYNEIEKEVGEEFPLVANNMHYINYENYENYINRLLHNTIEKVSETKNKDWSIVKDEFLEHYLS